MEVSRRSVLGMALSAGTLATRGRLAAQSNPQQAPAPDPLFENTRRSTVSLVHGESRRQNVIDALTAIDEQIKPVLKTKKYVILKPNMVSTVNPLAATNGDALR